MIVLNFEKILSKYITTYYNQNQKITLTDRTIIWQFMNQHMTELFMNEYIAEHWISGAWKAQFSKVCNENGICKWNCESFPDTSDWVRQQKLFIFGFVLVWRGPRTSMCRCIARAGSLQGRTLPPREERPDLYAPCRTQPCLSDCRHTDLQEFRQSFRDTSTQPGSQFM